MARLKQVDLDHSREWGLEDDVDSPSERVVAQCGHSFHRDCVSEYLEQAPELPSGGIGCPTCFAPLTVNLEEADTEEV